MKKLTVFLFTAFAVLAFSSCKDDEDSKPDMPNINVIDISGESNWDYCVLGTNDYYFIKANGSIPEAVFFYSHEANQNYSIFFSNDGYLDKVFVDDFIVSFRNPDGNKIDIGIIYPNGNIEILRDLETNFDWDNYRLLKSSKSIEAWSDVIRWTGRVVSGVPCGLSVAAAVATSGVGTPLAVWVCGNYLLGLSADIMENEFDIHNGFTNFVAAWGAHATIASCSGGDAFLVCASDLTSRAFSEWSDHRESIENRRNDVQLMDAALEYGDVQIKLSAEIHEYNSDWENIVLNEFGTNYRVADWNDLLNFYNSGGNLLELFDALGLTEYNSSAFLKRNGQQFYSSTRAYFASRHEHNRPSSYLAHENINNYLISLGSWYGARKIMVIKK